MNHPDKRTAKHIDMPGRCAAFTDIVYSGESGHPTDLWAAMTAAERAFYPPPPALHPFVGEMHGHTNLSDGRPDIDTYFTNLRDIAKLDFAVLSDHDHGGVGRPELWVGDPSKWDIIREKVKEYRIDGTFTTLLAYERDAYPFFNNIVIYFADDNAAMIRGKRDGELTEAELSALLARDDCFIVPHDTYSLSSGTDFLSLPLDLMPPFMEIISRGDAAEYMGNPAADTSDSCEGGYFQDALGRGVHMGVIGGSDDHGGMGGQLVPALGYPGMYPGLTGIWAEENTHEAIFQALKAKRTYAFMGGPLEGEMGGRMEIDFRINSHWMGEVVTLPADTDLSVYFSVKSDVPVKRVTVVKNCRNYVSLTKSSALFFDYKQERDTDIYYLRVELRDGRFGWTSPISVRRS